MGGDLITQCAGLRDLLVPLHGRHGGIDAAVDIVHQVIGHMDPGDTILVRRFHNSVEIGYANRAQLPQNSHTVEVFIRDALSGLRELIVDDKVLLIVAPAIRGILFVSGLPFEIGELDLLHILSRIGRLQALVQHTISIHHMINTGNIRINNGFLGVDGVEDQIAFLVHIVPALDLVHQFSQRLVAILLTGDVGTIDGAELPPGNGVVTIFRGRHKRLSSVYSITGDIVLAVCAPEGNDDRPRGLLRSFLIVGLIVVVRVLGPDSVDRNVRI